MRNESMILFGFSKAVLIFSPSYSILRCMHSLHDQLVPQSFTSCIGSAIASAEIAYFAGWLSKYSLNKRDHDINLPKHFDEHIKEMLNE